MSNAPVIAFRDVSFSFNGIKIVENVNLTVQEHELVSIVGPNGGGKTTLLKLMLGLLEPKTGEVRVFGEPPERVRSRIGYMPQSIHYDAQFPVTVTDIVMMGRLGRKGFGGLLGWHGRNDREAALKALRQVEMDEFADRHFSALSGGQRQRIFIARALACDPELLLLDEPTAHVDAHIEDKFLEILLELNKRMTILMVSHDLGFVSDIVKSVICVSRQVVVHPMSEITGENIQEVYGCGLRMVRHDHRCSDKGHICD